MISPRSDMFPIKIPDATPGIVTAYVLNRKQNILARVRYNRLVDMFLGIITFSLQNTFLSLDGETSIALDELYVGCDKFGRQFAIVVFIDADEALCENLTEVFDRINRRHPDLITRSIVINESHDGRLSMLEIAIEADQIQVLTERCYKLVPPKSISRDDIMKLRIVASEPELG